MNKCILYYTCNTHAPEIEAACRQQLQVARGDCDLVSVSRQSIEFGQWNIVVDRPRSAETMHIQILAGLERIEAEYVFLCENDILYHSSHFEIEPMRNGLFYYNTSVWRLRYSDGLAVWTDDLQQTSGVSASHQLLLRFYRERVAQIGRDGFDRHFEPGPKTGPYETENWQSRICNVDIRHNKNLTRSKWRPGDFRNQKYARGWQETRDIPGWGDTQNILQMIRGFGDE